MHPCFSHATVQEPVQSTREKEEEKSDVAYDRESGHNHSGNHGNHDHSDHNGRCQP